MSYFYSTSEDESNTLGQNIDKEWERRMLKMNIKYSQWAKIKNSYKGFAETKRRAENVNCPVFR